MISHLNLFRMKTFPLLSLAVLMLFVSCDEDNPAINPEDPSNLELEIVVSEDGSGLVEINANADNAVEYEIDLGESEVDNVLNSSGYLAYKYDLTGVYLVEVKAYGSNGRFLRKSQEINVQVGESTGPIDGEDGYITPLSYDGMTLIWQDEFNGSALNEGDWNYEIGTGSNGWGNNELQYYRKENTSVSDGFLTIEAKQQSFEGRSYTSSRLTTQNKFDFKYGRVDIRAVLPMGQGIWPALWMLGDNFSSVGWPSCGEVDIMEMIGGGEGKDDTTHGTIHWDNNGSYANFGGSKRLVNGIFNEKFYVFTIIWDATKITWFLNDEQFHVVDITPGNLSEFQNEFFFIFNVAVGGNWPGSPNSSTSFPQKMVVDYVRVFQDN